MSQPPCHRYTGSMPASAHTANAGLANACQPDTPVQSDRQGSQQEAQTALPPAFVPGAPFSRGQSDGSTPSPLVLPEGQYVGLRQRLQAHLQRSTHGMCFSPYLDGQGPGHQVSAAQIQARLAVLQGRTRWVRSFSCTEGNEQIPALAKAMGFNTLVGAWLGTDTAINEAEIAAVIEVARAGHADIVAVGNEVMLREDMSEDALLGWIHRVKDALPGVRVGYVDAYYLFELHPRITAACDVLLTNCYPFWEGCPLHQALPYMQSMYRRTVSVAQGKQVIISETGWPDKGSAFWGAVPSADAAMQYFVDTFDWAERDGVEVFWFAAFDEAWKVGAEGDVGAWWGLWNKDSQPKYF